MCFSAEVSFVSAAVLAVTGLVLGYQFRGDRRFFIAIAPFLFALQQFSEGWLWVAMNRGQYPLPWSLLTEHLYLFFAYLFWPTYTPFAFYMAELEPKRKKWLGALSIAALLAALVMAIRLIQSYPVEASVIGNSINYGLVNPILQLLYILVVLASFALSSLPRMWWAGGVVAVSFIVAAYVYDYAFTSVWCFFVAIISFMLFFVLTAPIKRPNKS